MIAFPDFWKGERDEGIQLRGPAQVRTDPGGRFTLAGLPDAKYRVRASRSGSQQSLWQSQGVEASIGDKEVRIVLPTDGGIKGEHGEINGFLYRRRSSACSKRHSAVNTASTFWSGGGSSE